MNENTSSRGWVIAVIVVVLIGLGIWLWNSQSATQTPTSADVVATTTDTGKSVMVENRSSQTVAAIVASLPDTSQFNAAFQSSGVAAQLTGRGPYTIFVPTNEAFAFLPQGTISSMTAAQVKRLIQFHIVTKNLDIDSVSSGNIQALSKDMLNFNVNLKTSTVTVGSAYALNEYKGSNGVVYLITAVLFPPKP